MATLSGITASITKRFGDFGLRSVLAIQRVLPASHLDHRIADLGRSRPMLRPYHAEAQSRTGEGRRAGASR
jgi:hypothetical protein